VKLTISRWDTGSSLRRLFLQLFFLLLWHTLYFTLQCTISCPSKATMSVRDQKTLPHSNQTNWCHLSMQHINFTQIHFACTLHLTFSYCWVISCNLFPYCCNTPHWWRFFLSPTVWSLLLPCTMYMLTHAHPTVQNLHY